MVPRRRSSSPTDCLRASTRATSAPTADTSRPPTIASTPRCRLGAPQDRVRAQRYRPRPSTRCSSRSRVCATSPLQTRSRTILVALGPHSMRRSPPACAVVQLSVPLLQLLSPQGRRIARALHFRIDVVRSSINVEQPGFYADRAASWVDHQRARVFRRNTVLLKRIKSLTLPNDARLRVDDARVSAKNARASRPSRLLPAISRLPRGTSRVEQPTGDFKRHRLWHNVCFFPSATSRR